MPRWVGKVRADGQVLSWSSLDVAGSVRAHWLVRGNFELELDDGTSLFVDASSRELDVQPVHERRDHWRDLESLPECRMFRATGPAPHTKVVLKTSSVSGGDRVTVFGSVVDEAFEPGSDHRSAPEKRPSRIRAERVVLGEVDEPDDSPDRPAPDASSFGVAPGTIIGLLTIVVALGFAAYQHSQEAVLTSRPVDLVIFAMGLLAGTVVWQFHVGHPPGFIYRDRYVDARPGWSAFGFCLVTWVILAGPALMFDGGFVDRQLVNNQGFIVLGSVLVAAAALLLVLITSFKTLRLIDVILNANPLSGLSVGTYGRIEGVVHDPTPVLDGVAMAAKRELEWTDGSGPHDLDMTTHNQDSFFVRTDHGDVEIEAGAGIWATDVRRFPANRGFAGLRVPADGRLLLSTELIPQNAQIVVAGRVQGGDPFAMKNTGAESLVFFATKPGGDPIASLRRARLIRVLVVAFCLACGAGAWTLAEVTRDDLPERRMYLPDTD